MKTVVLLICIFLFGSPYFVAAQDDTTKSDRPDFKRWTITASTGYGWPAVKSVLGTKVIENDQQVVVQRPLLGSLGNGIYNSALVGFSLTRSLGVEAGLFTFWGAKTQTTHWDQPSRPMEDDSYMRINSKGMLIGLFACETLSKVRISVHNDFMLGLSNRMYYQRHTETTGLVTDTDWQCYGGMSYGWTGKAAAAYSLDDKFEVGLEGFFILHTWVPEKGESGTMTLTYNYGSETITMGPSSQELKTAYPLHAAGGNIFLSYSF